MKGYIYIAGAFKTLDPASSSQVDNDPHFWSEPPTWGICRTDLRACAEKDDVIFFVLPKASGLPQTIFAYLKIDEMISHAEAFSRPDLVHKRMSRKRPDGNIIVNSKGEYEVFDDWVHKGNFDRIKRHYAVGSSSGSKFLSPEKIQALAPDFVRRAAEILESNGKNAIELLGQKGRRLSEKQVDEFLAWLA